LTEEHHLITALKNPKEKHMAFGTLLKIYKERLYWHIRKIVISHDDADDVLQNTFIKIYKNIDNFKGESQLYSWMYRIATNESLTHLKKQSKKQQLSTSEYKEQLIMNLEADVYFEGNEIQKKLQMAIAQLPEKQQLVFNMKYFDEVKYKDMAKILETSEGALKSSYHLAVKKIKLFLTSN